MKKLFFIIVAVLFLIPLSLKAQVPPGNCGTISSCPQVTAPLTGNELVPVVQNGATKKATVGQIGVTAFAWASSSSVTIGTGNQTFVVSTAAPFYAGEYVQSVYTGNSSDSVWGTVSSFTASTGTLVINVVSTSGSGTFSNWTISPSGAQGSVAFANPTATAGPTAINGSATTAMRSDAAPAVAKGTNSTFGIFEVDNSTIIAPGSVLSVANSGVTAGSYTSANITVNAKGLITAASNGTQNVPPKWSITGFVPTSISGTSTTAAVTISAGQAVDSTDATYISTTSNTSWAVSNGNAINGYAGGTTLPNSSTIHFYMCSGSSGTGSFASSTYSGAPASLCPPGYNSYGRRIFSLVTNSGGALINAIVTEISGGGLRFDWAPITDFTNSGSFATALQTLTVPTGIVVQPLIGGTVDASGSSSATLSVGASSSMMQQFILQSVGSSYATGSSPPVPGPPTNTSGQIYVEVSSVAGTATSSIFNNGFIDGRRN